MNFIIVIVMLGILLATDKFMNLVEYRNLSSCVTRDLIFFFS